MAAGSLPFLDDQAVTLTEPDAVVQRIADQLPLRGLLRSPAVPDLRMRNVVLQVGALSVAGSAHSPLRIEMAPLPDALTLAFTEQGAVDLTAAGQRVRLAPRRTAMFLPCCAFHCETEAIVSVLIHDSARQLSATAAAIAGSASDGAALKSSPFDRPVLLDAEQDSRRGALLGSLRRALRLLDQPVLQDGNGFQALQLEDLLRRHLALLLWPSLLDPAPAKPADGCRDPILEELLEWIDAHHHQPLTLSQLAERSGDSLRNLQYRFRRRVGCSPMGWLRQRRLEAVRAELARPDPSDTVAAVARRHGFHHLPTFTASFRRRYGQLPSQLLRQGRRAVTD